MPGRKDIYMIIGIMGAMPDEVDQLCAKLENVTVELYGGVEYHRGTLAGKQVVVCCAGMGKANAAATTQVLITRYGAEKIIFSGIAGNMTSKIGIGDVVIGKTVLYHDAQLDMICQNPPYLKEYAGDPALIAAAEKACAEAGVKALTGKIATGDLFVGDSETKAAIEAKCAPDCVEMEGAAVSQIAAKNDVPCVILRAMSDNADEDGHEVLVVKKFSIAEYAGDPALIAAAEKACAEAGVKALTGKIATGDLFVGDSETKAAIEAKCAPDCVEMEGAAVSQIAAKNDVPCVILRAMSDNADEDGHEVLVVKKFSIAEYVATATRIVAAMVEAL